MGFYSDFIKAGISGTVAVNPFLVALYDRYIYLTENEPISDGMVHIKWEGQISSIESLIESFEKLKDFVDCQFSKEDVTSQYEACKKLVIAHQLEYGGLKHLKI